MPVDETLTTVRLGYFSRSVVLRTARERGYFADSGIHVVDEPVPSSPAQFRTLLSGGFDMVLTSPDNVVAYRMSDRNPLGTRADVRMLLGIDRGMGLSIMASAEVTTVDDVRGRTVAVDVPQSGFALAMFRVLADHGLQRDRDYSVVSLGSTPGRADALIAGECDVTLLNAGHDVRAEVAGCRRLIRITDALSPYIGTVLAATGPWLADNLDVATRFAAAWRRATAVVLDAANQQDVQRLLAEELHLDGEGPELAYRTLCSDSDGLIKDLQVDTAGLRTILDTRAQGGDAPAIDNSPDGIAASGLVDNRLYL
jgi:ABC-type nitrate/sulfonate/bicarbonate transport system substrate-binding protein